MLELGQPNHTFDLDDRPERHAPGAPGPRRRDARDPRRHRTHAGPQRRGHHERGRRDHLARRCHGRRHDTEISDATTSNVLLEMAWWDPPSISRTVKRLNLPSEASTRFRRGADYGDNIPRAMRRFIQLAAEIRCHRGHRGMIDVAGTTPDRTPVPVRVARVNGLLGTSLSSGRDGRPARADRLRGEIRRAATTSSTSPIPTWRWDTTTETDIAEEVGRMYGYMNIELTVPKGTDARRAHPVPEGPPPAVREVAGRAGCDETLPMPFLAPGDLAKAGLPEDGVTLTNPLHAEESVLRTSLLPGQLKAIAYNQSHRNPDVRSSSRSTTSSCPSPEGRSAAARRAGVPRRRARGSGGARRRWPSSTRSTAPSPCPTCS